MCARSLVRHEAEQERVNAVRDRVERSALLGTAGCDQPTAVGDMPDEVLSLPQVVDVGVERGVAAIFGAWFIRVTGHCSGLLVRSGPSPSAVLRTARGALPSFRASRLAGGVETSSARPANRVARWPRYGLSAPRRGAHGAAAPRARGGGGNAPPAAMRAHPGVERPRAPVELVAEL